MLTDLSIRGVLSIVLQCSLCRTRITLKGVHLETDSGREPSWIRSSFQLRQAKTALTVMYASKLDVQIIVCFKIKLAMIVNIVNTLTRYKPQMIQQALPKCSPRCSGELRQGPSASNLVERGTFAWVRLSEPRHSECNIHQIC